MNRDRQNARHSSLPQNLAVDFLREVEVRQAEAMALYSVKGSPEKDLTARRTLFRRAFLSTLKDFKAACQKVLGA